jgi:hypothetical protein
MDLYCDNGHPFHGDKKIDCVGFTNYSGPTEADCKKQARHSGWKFVKGDLGVDSKVYCKHCKHVLKR